MNSETIHVQIPTPPLDCADAFGYVPNLSFTHPLLKLQTHPLYPKMFSQPTIFSCLLGRWIRGGKGWAAPKSLLKQEAMKLLSLTMGGSCDRPALNGGGHDFWTWARAGGTPNQLSSSPSPL